MKKPNPIIEKARQEGFNRGFQLGIETGREAFEVGKQFWDKQILDWLDTLEQLPGFGKKRVQQIASHFTNTFKG